MPTLDTWSQKASRLLLFILAAQLPVFVFASLAFDSSLLVTFGLGALTAFASTYRSWGVLSYTTANDRVLTVGAFGVVYVRQ